MHDHKHLIRTPHEDVISGGAAIDPRRVPTGVYLVDTFAVPAEARAELEAAMARNRAFIRTLDGFRGDAVLVRGHGEAGFDLVTIAAWESPEAFERAKDQVTAYYQRIGFDPAQALARWGVTMQRAVCTAPPALQ